MNIKEACRLTDNVDNCADEESPGFTGQDAG